MVTFLDIEIAPLACPSQNVMQNDTLKQFAVQFGIYA